MACGWDIMSPQPPSIIVFTSHSPSLRTSRVVFREVIAFLPLVKVTVSFSVASESLAKKTTGLCVSLPVIGCL
ncbi:MAG TPA: hypothetical protein VI356_07635 [Myxococcales bacterium]